VFDKPSDRADRHAGDVRQNDGALVLSQPQQVTSVRPSRKSRRHGLIDQRGEQNVGRAWTICALDLCCRSIEAGPSQSARNRLIWADSDINQSFLDDTEHNHLYRKMPGSQGECALRGWSGCGLGPALACGCDLQRKLPRPAASVDIAGGTLVRPAQGEVGTETAYGAPLDSR
jgi:hypothetical protein